jgi:hypothetical protein
MTWERTATWKECGKTLLLGIALAVAGASLLAPFIWLAFCAVGLSPMTWDGLLTLWLILLGVGFVWLLFAAAFMVRELYSKKSPPPGSTHSTMVMEINPSSRAGESANSSSALIIARLETNHSTKPPPPGRV